MANELTKYLAHHIDRSQKTHAQIAQEVGFKTPNIISLIKTGRTKLPLERVPAMARALDTPVHTLADLAIKDRGQGLWEMIHECYVKPMLAESGQGSVESRPT